MESENEIKSRSNKLPACAVEFISQVLKKMRYRRKVRQDVQAELAEHFENELKDCKTDENREQKAKQLITDFGDVKMLAVLLRRAKKRCRPLWRTVVARTFQAVGVLILCFIFYVIWFLTGKPVITTNYVTQLNNMVRPVTDESLNAAPLYLNAVGLHKELSDDFLLFFAQNHQAISEELSDEFLMFFAMNYQAIADEKGQNKVEVLADRVDGLLSNNKHLNFQQERENIQEIVSELFSQFLRKKYSDFTIEQRKMAKRWLQEHNDALELIIEGSRKPYYWRTYKSDSEKPGEMISVPVPDLSIFRDLAYSLRLRIWLSAEQGHFKDAFDDLKSCYRFGQQIRGDKTLIEQLVGIAIEALAVRTIRDIVGGYEIDSTILADFQRDFQQIIADENFAISFKAEKLFLYDEIQRCFTSDRIGKGHLYLPRFEKLKEAEGSYEGEPGDFIVESLASAPFLLMHPNKEETLRTANAFYDYYEKLSLKTALQGHIESEDIDKKVEEFLKGNYFLNLITPAVLRVIQISHRLPVDVKGALTMIAIFRYKADKGRYPQNLNQLVTAGYLKQLPIDSFSDKPLSYRKTEDNFILYSVGPNFIDDGGEYSRDSKGRIKNWLDNGDTVFWPVPKSDIKQ